MDGSERKRKRSKSGNVDSGSRRHKKEDATVTTTTTTTTPQPTEEEVDEFFTILNRMRVTVKYFKNNRSSNTNNEGDAIIPGVELPELHGSKADVKVGADNFVLDLNSLPDGENNSD
ncbi:hypothetical protein POM88_003896 [Heracleum sosnowskyi]|uniref:Uncharacterized protein n=1 Tax=Heracleum sosnowskyi TaxID=360622 RepID=A0AAD8JKH6_9APIA|nr:hypothetical protein POM88_003896 [Heracleum sosnowskyi]